VNWYRQNKRPLPWRSDPHPYKILISEFMAQQTQIATVVPYFNRWMNQFPTIEDVARAEIDTILKAWEGLGYYSRARNLHKTCQCITDMYNGIVPKDYDTLCSLPGIGPYIASAIVSIAYKVPIAVVDGNVLRVFTRFWNIDDDIRRPSTKQIIQDKLTEPIVRSQSASCFNQGIMELGATICTPKTPKCLKCPIESSCQAYLHDRVNQLPIKSPAKKVPHHNIGIGVIWNNGKILIAKRPLDQMLGGLWEFPGGKQEDHEPIEQTVHREIKEETSLDVSIISPLCSVKHAFSHFKITLHVYSCQYISGNAHPNSSTELKWVDPKELTHYAFPTANKKIINVIFKSIDHA
ncbi:A/G-specific adenine glycosylase, partial [Chlamydiia bacterium]|nr:A/G-specific adenine glycosylase [Chlamydiia bacterium]